MYESEYTHSEHSTHEAPLEATIFDDALLDEMAEKLGSYDEARRNLGLTTPEYKIPKPEQPPTEGAFVELGARALAVHQIMESINLRNKAMGAQLASTTDGSKFNQQYKHPEDILSGMHYNVNRSLKVVKEDIDLLNATDAMLAAGFEPEQVEASRSDLRHQVESYEGTGRWNVTRRRKEAEKVQEAAVHLKKHRAR